MTRPALPTDPQWREWGIDPAWSSLVEVPCASVVEVPHSGDESGRASVPGAFDTWHVLDTGPRTRWSSTAGDDSNAPVTIVCVHGNPTWSFMWRSFLQTLGAHHRVVAVDQLGMGFSDRTERRRFAQRVDDLARVIDALAIDGPIVIAAHDWGGPISLGWALRNQSRVRGIVLCNTGVAVPRRRRAPAVIRLAAAGPITDFVGRRTRIFLEATLRLSGRRITAAARGGYRAPYTRAEWRKSIAEFVADVPFSPDDVSAVAIADVAEGIRELAVPVLLAWGAKDAVFNDDFALDLASRMPQSDRHRFPGLGHLIVEEADIATLVETWLADQPAGEPSSGVSGEQASDAPAFRAEASTETPIWFELERRAEDSAIAFVDGASGTSTSFAALHERVLGVAGSLAAMGVARGDRIAVLVPPGVDLLTTVYGCWRAGAVTVIADRGLGLRGLGRAVRGAHVEWVIGPPKAIAAARLLRWAPLATHVTIGRRSLGRHRIDLDEPARTTQPAPPAPGPDDVAAILYTSGATGPAKGVRYLHRQLNAQRDALRALYSITPDDRLVAAFAPFALYGPALGITSTIPDVDVTIPSTLTADSLATSVAAIGATLVFASPAALANVVSTSTVADHRLDCVRLVLSAGAPVPVTTLRAMAGLCPLSELHTPYGMTECLPVADIDLGERDIASGGVGVCVGRPVPGVELLIAPLGFDAATDVASVTCLGTSNGMGEVLVRARWLSDGYDQLWRTEHDARPHTADGRVWHRSGDVGRLDDAGRLWIEGRNVHVIHVVDGPITPVPVEVAVEARIGALRVAAVGVGPIGCQQLVVVLEDPLRDEGLADAESTDIVRAAVGVHVAAVLTVAALPVDIRHNTKIDRTAVASWASAVLAGDRVRRPW